MEPRVLNSTRGLRLCLRLLSAYVWTSYPESLTSSYLKNPILLWVLTLRMVSPRSPLAITATMAEDKACSHCGETREGIRGTEMEAERQIVRRRQREIQ